MLYKMPWKIFNLRLVLTTLCDYFPMSCLEKCDILAGIPNQRANNLSSVCKVSKEFNSTYGRVTHACSFISNIVSRFIRSMYGIFYKEVPTIFTTKHFHVPNARIPIEEYDDIEILRESLPSDDEDHEENFSEPDDQVQDDIQQGENNQGEKNPFLDIAAETLNQEDPLLEEQEDPLLEQEDPLPEEQILIDGEFEINYAALQLLIAEYQVKLQVLEDSYERALQQAQVLHDLYASIVPELPDKEAAPELLDKEDVSELPDKEVVHKLPDKEAAPEFPDKEAIPELSDVFSEMSEQNIPEMSEQDVPDLPEKDEPQLSEEDEPEMTEQDGPELSVQNEPELSEQEGHVLSEQ